MTTRTAPPRPRRPRSSSPLAEFTADSSPPAIEPPQEVLYRHRDIGPVITNPKHGDCGWTPDGELKIFAVEFRVFDDRGDRRVGTNQGGWLLLREYQALKVRVAGKQDWRLAEVRDAGWIAPRSTPTRSDYYSGYPERPERRSSFFGW